MKRLSRKGRVFATGTIVAVLLALFTWWFVSGLAICPSNGDLAQECREEADRIGLGFAAVVGGVVALVTGAILFFNRRANP